MPNMASGCDFRVISKQRLCIGPMFAGNDSSTTFYCVGSGVVGVFVDVRVRVLLSSAIFPLLITFLIISTNP